MKTPENEEAEEEMICCQEDHPGTPKSYCRGIKDLTIFCTNNDSRKFKRLITRYMNDATQKRKIELFILSIE